MSAQRIAVLYGGVTAEREVSLLSGQAVSEGLQALGKEVVAVDLGANMAQQILGLDVDAVFIALHGGAGEGGRVQALLDMLEIPYTGSGVAASALAMDKARCKQLWKGIGLPSADFAMLTAESNWESELERLHGHAMVKPVREGSSVGMSQARNAAELKEAYQLAAQYDNQVMAEAWLGGEEYTIGVIGDEVLPIVQLQVDEEFYTYNAKYLSETTGYLCPAPVSAELDTEIRQLALDAYRAVGCRGWGRVDLMLDASGAPQLLEVNTSPGMTSHSLVPMAARQAGYDFPQLVGRIVEEAGCG